jgi:type II secretory pathway component GspD/PulD (secretin)
MRNRFVLACCLLAWAGTPAGSAPAAPNATVTLQLKETPLHQALAILFDQLGVPYSIAADVPNPPITLKVQEMPFPEALRAIVRLGSTREQVQGVGVVTRAVTYAKTGDLYQIELRRADPPPPLGPGIRELGGRAGQEAQVEKVPMNYLRANEAVTQLAPQLSSGGIVSIQPLSQDNSLLVRGDADAIQHLKRVIRLMDVPPRPLQASVGISGPGINGAPIALRSMARTLIGNDVTIDEEAVIGGQPAHLKVTLRTQLQGDGTLQVASDWDVSVPVAGGPKGPVRLVKRLSTTTQLPPGEQVPVAEVDLAGWGGKGVLQLWIRGEYGGRAAAAGAR